MKFLKSNFIKITLFLLLFNCVEQIDIQNIAFDNLLVIEASITNEFKKHQIKLSRTFELNTQTETFETGATVIITDDSGTVYNYQEIVTGTYESTNAFKADVGKSYTLKVTTKDGNSYNSTAQELTPIATINELTTNIETSTDGFNGVQIYASGNSATNNANYYRYTYEETYLISPAFWSDKELRIVSDRIPFRVEVVERTVENKTCYKTLNSTEILVAETNSLAEDNVVFPVKFLLDTDVKISKRYSILVKQFVQTPEAYNYYETLKKLSSSDNVFAQSQPGFIIGNITSETNPNERVIGFFQASSVSEKRLFFNYNDVFPGSIFDDPLNCEFAAPILFDSFTQQSPLVDLIRDNSYTYYRENDIGQEALEGPYLMVPKECGDCTVSGSNTKPAFWID